MIKGISESVKRNPSATYFVVEVYPREVIFEGYLDDLERFDYNGYRVSGEVYIGDGILRIVLIED